MGFFNTYFYSPLTILVFEVSGTHFRKVSGILQQRSSLQLAKAIILSQRRTLANFHHQIHIFTCVVCSINWLHEFHPLLRTGFNVIDFLFDKNIPYKQHRSGDNLFCALQNVWHSFLIWTVRTYLTGVKESLPCI